MALGAPFALLSRDSDAPVPAGGFRCSVDDLDSQEARDAYFFLLDGRNQDEAVELLRQIRGHADTKIYLKPVVLGEGAARSDPLLCAAVDVVGAARGDGFPVSPEQEEAINAIRSSRHYQQKIPSVIGQQQISMRLLRFMASRGDEQEPMQTPEFLGGYVYPKLTMLFPEDDSSIWDLLEELEKQHLVEGRFIARAFHCVHCECAFLNFMETCPDCGSPNLNSEDLIHHFRCAYAGPMSEFRRGDVLVCPKCDFGLKHIGVDYDKPSLTFRCNDCQYVFEDPIPTTVCYNCGRRTAPEDQQQRTVKAYSITALGSNIAIFGQEQMFTRLLKENLELIDNESFSRLVKMEKERIRRYKKSVSSLMVVEIKGLADALAELGDRGVEFYRDMANVFVAEIRSSDIMTIVGRSIANVLMPETDSDAAEIAMQRIIRRLDGLFDETMSMPSGAQGKVLRVEDIQSWDEVARG